MGPVRVRRAFLAGLITAAVVAAFIFPGSVLANTGGAATTAGGPPPPGSSAGAPSPDPSAGTLTLTVAETAPRKSFDFGDRYPRLSLQLTNHRPHRSH